MEQELTIGRMARESGCRVQTVRYYEQIGLMPEPHRTAGGQRRYGRAQADRLRFIRHSRELGFSLAAIRELLDLTDDPERSCAAADAVARTHLAQVEERIRRLEALRAELERMIEQCRGGTICDCHVIEVLADASHGNCLGNRHEDVG